MKIDITYYIKKNRGWGDAVAFFTAHTHDGKEFLEDHLPNGECWIALLRNDFHMGKIQLAQGRGLSVVESDTPA